MVVDGLMIGVLEGRRVLEDFVDLGAHLLALLENTFCARF